MKKSIIIIGLLVCIFRLGFVLAAEKNKIPAPNKPETKKITKPIIKDMPLMPLPECQPDLVVQDLRLWPMDQNRQIPKSGDIINYSFLIKNENQSCACPAPEIKIAIDKTKGGVPLADYPRISTLNDWSGSTNINQGATVNLGQRGRYAGTVRLDEVNEYIFSIEVDPNSKINEANRNNNKQQTTFWVFDSPDLTIGQFFAYDGVIPGKKASIVLGIMAKGFENFPLTVPVRIVVDRKNPQGGWDRLNDQTQNITVVINRPNYDALARANDFDLPEGEYRVTATVDPEGVFRIQEGNRLRNNEDSQPFTVRPAQ